MSSSSQTTISNDHCERCQSTYTFIKKKKTCAICQLSYCANCAPRERYQNQSYRICLTCQLISNDSTTDDQLLALKVKHLRCYLQAKNISNHTCTEKQELVNLIVRNRKSPFPQLSTRETPTSSVTNSTNQEQSHTRSSTSANSTETMPPPQPPKMDSNSKPFVHLQHTVSSLANQMNNFATNIQDYVSNTVSGVINQALNDQPQQSTTATNNSNSSTSFNFGSTSNGPFNYSFSTPTGSARPNTTTTNNANSNSQQQQTGPSSRNTASAAAASSASTAKPKVRRKSLSEIKNEENIEDLNIRDLKDVLTANFVDFKGCVEKNELIEKVRRLYRDRQNEAIRAKELDSSAAGDNELCKICMDAIADCVFLDCGHMVTCVKCGKLLAECPICRSNIVRVVRVFKS